MENLRDSTNIGLLFSARERFSNDPERLKTVKSPWPPWRLPTPADEKFEDPRKLLHSSTAVYGQDTHANLPENGFFGLPEFTHGLIFNLLYKAVHHENSVNDFITSVAVHLLELAVTFPQHSEFSGKVSKSACGICS